jgi:hypothetical protein
MNYALAEMSNTEFNMYSLLLAISGILLIVTAATGFGGRSPGARAVNGIIGLAFVGYAIYLQFIFTSGTVFESYYVFVVPVLLIVQAFRNRAASKQSEAATQRTAATPTTADGHPNQPNHYPTPQPGNAIQAARPTDPAS